MIAFLAARRKLNQKKVEPSVQELNEQQEVAQQKVEEKDTNETKAGSCAIIFAVSLMMMIVAIICVISAAVDGGRIFYIAAGALAGS